MMMELSPMPPISEDCSSQGESDNGDEGDSNFEQLMVTMLEERDKLQENLRESQELLQNTIARLQDVEKERNQLNDQLSKTVPQDYMVLTRELNQIREALNEKDEEINELKSERNNTRLLLEHLETLVSRHEKSLRMTVVKRQSQNSANSGVSSEAEVLKALKSLFEHHKALDERYRERYKTAIEKCNNLEDELEKIKNELKIERESKQLSNQYLESLQKQQKPNEDGTEGGVGESQITLTELQSILDKQSKELTEHKHKILDLQQKSKDTEEKLRISEEKNFNLSKELLISQETNKKLQRDLKESLLQKDDQEQRISTLEQRYVNVQRECSSLHDLNNRLETELSIKDNSFKHAEERYKNLQTRLDSSEQKYEQLLKKTQLNNLTSNTDNVDSATKSALIAQFQEKHTNIEEKLASLQAELEDAKTELIRSRQREKMSEEHNTRLTQTVDKLLNDSNERLQLHLKERMQSLDEKNTQTQECERLRKLIEDLETDKNKLYLEIERLKADLDYSRKEQTNTQQKIKELNANYLNKLNQFKMSTLNDHLMHQSNQYYDEQVMPNLDYNHSITQRFNNSMNFNEHDLNSANDWDKLEEAVNVIANVQHAFDMGSEDPDLGIGLNVGVMNNNNDDDEDDDEDEDALLAAPYNRVIQHSPQRSLSPQHTDAQTIAFLLQKQLDEIDNEIRLIKEEKQNAQLQTERIGMRVGIPPDELITQPTHNLVHSNKSNNSSGRSTPHRVLDPMQKSMFVTNSLQRHLFDAELNETSPNHTSQSILANYPSWNATANNNTNSIDHIQHGGNSPLSSTHSSDDSLNRILSRQQQQQQQQQQSDSLNKKKLMKKPFFRLFGSQRKKSQKDINDNQNENTRNTQLTELQQLQQQQIQQQLQPGSIVLTADLDKRHKKKLELLEEAMHSNIPFQSWNGPTIVAWLELWVGMPAWYVAACKANVKSGSIMSALSDAEIHREIGISNPLHRLKLRLAIQEMVSLTSPSAPKNASALALAFGDMNHEWVGNFLLKHLGLEEYRGPFMECLIDARMLDHLGKKDLRIQLKMVDNFHRESLHHGISVLKRLNYNKSEFLKRISECELTNKDLLVWSNERVKTWLNSLNLSEYVKNSSLQGVHGGVFVFSESFTWNDLALKLEIPHTEPALRDGLQKAFNLLLANNTDRVFSDQNIKSTTSNHSIHERSSSVLNSAITASTNSVIIDDLESFSTTNKLYSPNQRYLHHNNNNNDNQKKLTTSSIINEINEATQYTNRNVSAL